MSERERIVAVNAAHRASLKPHERTAGALFLVTIAVLVRASWHYVFG